MKAQHIILILTHHKLFPAGRGVVNQAAKLKTASLQFLVAANQGDSIVSQADMCREDPVSPEFKACFKGLIEAAVAQAADNLKVCGSRVDEKPPFKMEQVQTVFGDANLGMSNGSQYLAQKEGCDVSKQVCTIAEYWIDQFCQEQLHPHVKFFFYSGSMANNVADFTASLDATLLNKRSMYSEQKLAEFKKRVVWCGTEGDYKAVPLIMEHLREQQRVVELAANKVYGKTERPEQPAATLQQASGAGQAAFTSSSNAMATLAEQAVAELEATTLPGQVASPKPELSQANSQQVPSHTACVAPHVMSESAQGRRVSEGLARKALRYFSFFACCQKGGRVKKMGDQYTP